MERIVKETDFYTLIYNSELKLGQITWYGSPEEREYKEVFELLLGLYPENEVQYVISDVSRQGAISPDLRNWFVQEAFPVAVNKGLQKAAVVYRNRPTKLYYINKVKEKADEIKFPLRVFTSLIDAMEWIQEETLVV